MSISGPGESSRQDDGLRAGAPAGSAVAAVVLAAGSSTRMGANKLLAEVGGEPLLRRAVRAAGGAGLAPVLVVVGHQAEAAREALRGLACAIVENPDHARGQSTSLSAGIAALPAEVAAAVVLLGDMPFVDEAVIRGAVARWRETGAPVVASRYGGVTAPPTLFERSLFPELQGGAGETRGREVARRHAARAAFVDWPETVGVDVDRPEDLEKTRARLDKGPP